MSHQNSMTNYINAFIQGLIDGGVSQAVISPGSRSTPVSILLHQCSEITTFVDVDERSAGFFALGLSKSSGKPVVLVCTSGTAAANYLPAIAEAKQSNVPLVVVTTDRPHELRDTGAPQTMNQINLYGPHVKQFVDMALSEQSEEMVQYAYTQGAKFVTIAHSAPNGPVHINVPLREPLLPNLELGMPEVTRLSTMIGSNRLSKDYLETLGNHWSNKKGIIIVGPSFDRNAIHLLIEFAEKVGWVILADPLSNIRTAGIFSETVSPYYDSYLRYMANEVVPDVVVRFGKSPVSKPLNQWLSQLSVPNYLVESTTEWLDFPKSMTTLIVSDEVSLLKDLLELPIEKACNEWIQLFKRLDSSVSSVINQLVPSMLSEGMVAKVVYETMREQDQLFVSNSMPIRDLDTYLPLTEQAFSVFGNRGVNGIDGITSTAAGVSANNLSHQTRLLIGDLAFFHDTTGLEMVKKYHLPLTVILVNNSGGGIFSMLSQKELPQSIFDELFATTLDVQFDSMAKMYGIEYVLVKTVDELKKVLSIESDGPRLIEAQTNREENAELRRTLQDDIRQKMVRDFSC